MNFKKSKNKKGVRRAIIITLACMMAASTSSVSALSKSSSASEYVYGTVNLPYADYYYGELNNIAENSELQLDVEDKVASLRDDGVLDAISSATTSKWSMYGTTYFGAHENEDGGGYIFGSGDCSVAISKTLYEQAVALVKDNIDNSKQCKNALLSIVSEFKPNENQSVVPEEYKILNGDGTLTATVNSKSTIETDLTNSSNATIANNTRYGHYQLDIKDENLPDKTELEGAVMEATDTNGFITKYALLHSDNLWFQTGHIAFCVKEGFVTHGNTLKYKQFDDIQGKTITKVTYFVRGGADVSYKTNLFCKYLLNSEQGYSSNGDTVFADGAKISLKKNLPTDSNYKLSSVMYNKTTLAEGSDYSYSNDTLTIKDTDSTSIGAYTLTFSDDKYANTSVSVQFTSNLTSNDIKIENNKIAIKSNDVKIADYVKGISSIKVNGSQLKNFNGVITEDGSINTDAEISFKGNTTIVFPEKGSYEIEITAPGYPVLIGTVVKSDEEATEPTTQSETQETSVAVTEATTTENNTLPSTDSTSSVETNSATSTSSSSNKTSNTNNNVVKTGATMFANIFALAFLALGAVMIIARKKFLK